MTDRNQTALSGQYEVRIGDWISRGWEIFKPDWGPHVGFTFLLLAILGVGAGIVKLIIGAHLFAGYFVVARKRIRGEPVDFGDYWRAFSQFLPFFLAGLLTWLLVMIGLIFCILPGIYLAVSYMLVLPILWDQRIDFWDAMELSRRVISRHWFSWFAFALLLVAMNIIGLLFCFVGVLFTIPISYCAIAAAYDDLLAIR